MLFSRHLRKMSKGRCLATSALAVVALTGSQFWASAEEQVALRRPRRVMVPNPYAPQYCPPPAPVCPPTVPDSVIVPTPAPTPTPAPAPTDPDKVPAPPSSTTPTTPPSETAPNNNNPDPLRDQPQAQAPQNFQPQADQSLASAANAQSSVPNIIGDFFGTTGGTANFTQNIAILNAAPGNGTSVTQLVDPTTQIRYQLADGSAINLGANQFLGVGVPVVAVDRSGQPIPGAPTVFIDVRNGVATLQQQQSGVAALPSINTGVVRLAESTSPIPRDRLFFNYSYFNNVPLAQGNVAVNRYTFGVEKTFLNGMTSIELRAPFATTLSNERVFNGTTDLSDRSDVQMADLLLTGKLLLWQTETFAFSTGVSFQGPTAHDTNVFSFDQTTSQFIQTAKIGHNSFHVLPFVGAVWTPTENTFIQSLLQIDQPFIGETVSVNARGIAGDPFVDIGKLNQQTFAYWTLSAGYWLFRDTPTDDWGVSGFAPIAEFHYNSSLNDEDSVSNGVYTFGGSGGKVEAMNATIGAVTQLGWNKSLYLGYTAPLGGGQDKQFNGEFRAIVNWRFGSPQFRNVPVFQ